MEFLSSKIKTYKMFFLTRFFSASEKNPVKKDH